MKIVKASATIGIFTFLSRIFGLARDFLTASVLGTSMIADSFFAAFRFPNMFRALFAEGAMNPAFMPIFTKTLDKDKGQAIAFVKQIGTLLLLWIVLFCILMIFFMPEIMAIQVRGFDKDRLLLTTNLARLMFPYLAFMTMNALFSSILNSFEQFILPAFVPVILNICMILSLIGVHYNFIPLTGYELSISVLIAGFLQALILFVTCLKYGIMPFTKTINITQNVKEFFKKIVPVIIGSSLVQLNIFVGTFLASKLESGSISYLNYSDRLSQLPLGVIGIAIGIALIPMLSKSIAQNNKKEIINNQSDAILFSMFLTLPASVAFLVIAPAIISGLFMYNNFDLISTYKTAYALQAMAIGLPAFVLIKVLSPVFFARGNTTIPMRISILCMVVNVLLAIILMEYIYHVGIALATSISAWLNVILLLIMISFKDIELIRKNTIKTLIKMLCASILMGVVIFELNDIFYEILISRSNIKILYLLFIVLSGLISYLIFSLLIGAISIKKIKYLMGKKQIK
jgi:putative peptidoglycan lipid II flippase